MTSAAIEKAYGFAFPPDLFELWAIAKQHRDAFDDAHVRFVGPFGFLNREKPAPDLGRWPADPPELFTVAEGDTDGLHWGYVLHEPGRARGWVAQFYAREGYPIETTYPTLLHAMRAHVDAIARDMSDELADIRKVGEDDDELARSLGRVRALASALAKKASKTRFSPPKERVSSLDGLGVRAPKNAFASPALDEAKLRKDLRTPASRDAWLARGHDFVAQKKAGSALLVARDALAALDTRDQDDAVLLAIAAYEALGRPLLARTFASRMKEIESHQKRTGAKKGAKKAQPSVDNRVSRSMEEALLAPSKVERLILEQWGAQPEPPDFGVIATFPKLSMLALRGYRLRDLPASVAKLGSLREIELFECGLVTLPKVLAKLPRLERIKIVQDSGRRIPRVPLAIPRGLAFKNLQSLSLVACGLREVPAFVLSSKKLGMLSLDGNRLTELPEALGALTRLRYLGLADNALSELPASVAKLKKLSSLWLKNNRFAALPDAIGKLPLKSIDVAQNPLVKDKAERLRTKKLAKKASIYWA